jgi:hypothetical protein
MLFLLLCFVSVTIVVSYGHMLTYSCFCGVYLVNVPSFWLVLTIGDDIVNELLPMLHYNFPFGTFSNI